MSDEIGPNGKQFLNEALPGNEGGHVLAVGERHNLPTAKDWTNQHLAELIKEHRLGTVGIEIEPYMNVFLWAYKDGNLPVSKDKSADYVRSMFESYSPSTFKENEDSSAMLAMQALDLGGDVMLFDGRNTFADAHNYYKKGLISARGAFAEVPEMKQWLHEDPTRLTKLSETGFLDNDSKHGYRLIEAEKLLEKHPEYKQRLDAMEKIILDGRNAGISTDAISATLLAASVKPGMNAISISGKAHLTGTLDKEDDIDGALQNHLQNEGINATPVIMASSSDLENSWIPTSSPDGGLYKDLQSNCSTRADMNLYVTDKDEVLRDLSKHPGQSSLLGGLFGAGTVGDELVKKGVIFSCMDNPALPPLHDASTLNPLIDPDLQADVQKMKALLASGSTPVPPPPDTRPAQTPSFK